MQGADVSKFDHKYFKNLSDAINRFRKEMYFSADRNANWYIQEVVIQDATPYMAECIADLPQGSVPTLFNMLMSDKNGVTGWVHVLLYMNEAGKRKAALDDNDVDRPKYNAMLANVNASKLRSLAWGILDALVDWQMVEGIDFRCRFSTVNIVRNYRYDLEQYFTPIPGHDEGVDYDHFVTLDFGSNAEFDNLVNKEAIRFSKSNEGREERSSEAYKEYESRKRDEWDDMTDEEAEVQAEAAAIMAEAEMKARANAKRHHPSAK